MGDMQLGDGGQSAIKAGADFEATIKRLWLFNLDIDPTEKNDLSAVHPTKVAVRITSYNMSKSFLVTT